MLVDLLLSADLVVVAIVGFRKRAEMKKERVRADYIRTNSYIRYYVILENG